MLFVAGILGMLLPRLNAGPHEMRSMAEISIAGHMIVFFLGAYVFYAFNPQFSEKSPGIQILLVILMTLFAGMILEGLQSLIPGRTASFRDMAANTTGALIFLSIKNMRSMRRYAILQISAAIFTALLIWPLSKALTDEFIANLQFPILASFETPFEASRFIRGTGRYSISDELAFHGSKSLRVKFCTKTYSGVALEYMPRNWRGYTHLQFAVYNPQEYPVTIHTRIHDAKHARSEKMIYADRFNRVFTIPSRNWTIVEIPLSDIKNAPRTRKMKMNQITNLGFFVSRQPEPVVMYIDDIRLKNNDL
jgi:hypothetical protein